MKDLDLFCAGMGSRPCPRSSVFTEQTSSYKFAVAMARAEGWHVVGSWGRQHMVCWHCWREGE